ncbi:DUF4381 domain-containing protein [Achromobacter sp. SD115]|uniref:DUF4381 domain-containing protein n=1 Tax=Achromobacter sp. SD115 TaxID=2782011 RepID=UPI001A9796D7|nr:DUF4381 domain-containing protein [Achromobacter sp. SD115]MBO1012563.1 DUF4381 domain-containing protein [Achromobacter sp. SD115]
MNADAAPSIEQLRQLPLPAPVSYWPQTWGWLVLLAAVLALAGWAAWRIARRRRRNRYRRTGLRMLEALRRQTQSDPLAARALPELLKRVGLSSVAEADRARVGALQGAEWVAFMDDGMAVFPPDASVLLRALAYAPPETLRAIDPARVRNLFLASRQWMERHHVAA